MLKLTSILIILVALLVSTSFCFRNSFPAHPRGPPPKVLARKSNEAAYRPPSPWQEAGQRHPFQHKDRTFIKNSSHSAVKYTLKGTFDQQAYSMHGQVRTSDGVLIGDWGLYRSKHPQLRGWVSTNLNGAYESYDMIALIPDDSSADTQGLLYNRDWMTEGTLVVKPADNDGKVQGQVTLDSSNSFSILRYDINKSTLKGPYYAVASSQLDKSVFGTVEVKNVSGDKYEGQLYQQNDGWYCLNKFSYQNADGFDINKFRIDLFGFRCYPGTRSSSLAKVGLSSKTSNLPPMPKQYADFVKLNETDQYITYGRQPQ